MTTWYLGQRVKPADLDSWPKHYANELGTLVDVNLQFETCSVVFDRVPNMHHIGLRYITPATRTDTKTLNETLACLPQT